MLHVSLLIYGSNASTLLELQHLVESKPLNVELTLML